MTKKPRWNIWRIKNRFLRAGFTLLAMTPLLLLALVITAIIAICAGIGEGVSYGRHVFKRNSDIKRMWPNYWRAITFREAA